MPVAAAESEEDLQESIEQKDWYRRLQDIKGAAIDDRERLKRMHLLTKDFLFVATLYAETIVAEKNLPVSEKTIKPASLGGVAGGAKYVAGSILFKVRSAIM